MRNLKIVRYSDILLGLVVLRTKAQNGFCPMCTKECCIVLTRSKPFWGQFWGQICKTDSHTHRLNTCAALVPLRNVDTNISGFSQVKSPKNQYISFSLQQEVVHKYYSAALLHTAPVAARNAPVLARSQRIGAILVQLYTAPHSPLLRLFAQERLFLCRLCPDGFRLYRKSLHKQILNK